jgi:hypothetical protein
MKLATRGETVALYGVLFFATVGVLTWVLVLPDGTAFAAGIAWGWVLIEVINWAKGAK